MLVIDENLHDQRIMEAISALYIGRVLSVVSLRPNSVIKDDAIPALLLQLTQATFVTINAGDFWRRIQPHSGYCVTVVDIPKERASEVPSYLRRFLRLSRFKTKSLRMGKVVRLTPGRIEYYESDRLVHSLSWFDQ
ncbi:MAG: hypothetical protein AB1791_16770 [Chloroflexota bacterium]